MAPNRRLVLACKSILGSPPDEELVALIKASDYQGISDWVDIALKHAQEELASFRASHPKLSRASANHEWDDTGELEWFEKEVGYREFDIGTLRHARLDVRDFGNIEMKPSKKSAL